MTFITALYIIIFVIAVFALLMYYRIQKPIIADRILKIFLLLITIDVIMMYIFKVLQLSISILVQQHHSGFPIRPCCTGCIKQQRIRRLI